MLTKKLTLIGLTALLAACSQAKFDTAKQTKLASTNVMGGDDATGSINQPEGPGSPAPTPIPAPTPGTGPTAPVMGDPNQPAYMVTPGQNNEKTWLFCSDQNKNVVGLTNFKKAYTLNYPIQLGVNGYLCSANKDAIRALIIQDTISIAQLRALCPTVVPQSGLIAPEVFVNNKSLGTGDVTGKSRLEVHWAANNNPTAGDEKDGNCDHISSPLVIHLSSNAAQPKPVSLTDKANGVLFDLLGAINSYLPVRISWFTNDEYRFVVLPDANGVVKGIDQLFGNHTLGPDGEFAANGYVALGKYDDNRDNRITKNDTVFAKLKLWGDANHNGKAEPEELASLADYQIAFIDLEYSEDFAEIDNWGNETKMKSVVGYEDGSLDVIFDLWFAYRLSGN